MTVRPRAMAMVSVIVLTVLSAILVRMTASAGDPPPARASAAASLRFEPVAFPAEPGSGQPALAVEGGRAVASWLERRGTRATLRFAERTSSGWSAPRVAASGDSFFVNAVDVPSVRAMADGSLVAHWLVLTSAAAEGYDVRLSFSRDGGTTWSEPVSPHHDGTKTQHGFVSLFQGPGRVAGSDAGLGLIWLDGRAMAGASDRPATDRMTLRAAFFTAHGHQFSETPVDDDVCDCCSTAAAVTPDGPIIAFRDRDDREVRDIHVSRFVNGAWTASVPVHADNWRVPVCPVNGPVLSARGRRVAVAWYSMRDGDDGHAYVAFSDDAGRTFGPPVQVDDEMSLGRIAIQLLPDGSAVVAWSEYRADDERSELRLRRVARDGSRSAPLAMDGLAAARTQGLPRLALTDTELLLAWTDASVPDHPRVRVMRAVLADHSASRGRESE